MPISPISFQPLSYSQAAPAWQALGQGVDASSNMQKIVDESISNSYLQQKLQAAIQGQQLQNATMSATLPFVGYSAMAPYLMAQARMGATTASMGNMLKNFLATPEGAKLAQNNPNVVSGINSYLNYASNYGNVMAGQPTQGGQPVQQAPSMQPAQTMPPDQTSPDVSRGTSDMGAPTQPQAAPDTSGFIPGQLPTQGQMPNPLAPQGGAQNLPMTPAQISKLQLLFSPQQAGQQTGAVPPLATDPTQQQDVNDALSRNYAKAVGTDYQRNKLSSGEIFMTTAAQALKEFDAGAGLYFSPTGQAQLKMDLAKSANPNDPVVTPALEHYRNFNALLAQLNPQGAFMENVPADQVSRGEYRKVYEIPKFFDNPVAARKQLVASINNGVQVDNKNKTILGMKANSPYFSNDIAEPKFSNKQDYQAWFNQLPRMHKLMIHEKYNRRNS